MVLLLSQSPLAAQQEDATRLLSSIMENIAEQREEEDIDYTHLLETYTALLEKPLNINAATVEELNGLQLLTDFQVYSLIEYIKQYGSLLSIQELALVHGFTEETVSLLKPFISIEEVNAPRKVPVQRLLSQGSSRLLLRTQRLVEMRKGYLLPDSPDNQRYQGTPNAYYAQYRYKYSHRLQLNLTAEKDAGEEFFQGSNRHGFDFYSFHLQLADMGIVKKLVVGDFRANFGQGLSLWNSLSFGKSADVLAVRRQATGLSGYSSTDENRFMRGAAIHLGYKNWTVAPFFSYKKIDATLSGDSLSTAFSSLTADGLHRTLKEIARKKVLRETIGGLNLAFHRPFLQVGTTVLWYRYGGDNERVEEPYNLYELHTSGNANASVDFRGVWKSISFWGEAGVSQNGGKAILSGALLDMNRFVQLSFIYRNYQRHYQASFAGAFGEGSKTTNEEGIYWGVNLMPYKYWRISAYLDTYSFPWLRYRVNSPSSGYDYLAQVNYTPSPDVSFHVRFQQINRKQNIPAGSTPLTSIQELDYLKIRFQADYVLSPELRMQSRIAYNRFSSEVAEVQQGTLLYHDVGYKFKKIPLGMAVRYAIFDTDSWETRFYAYESDVLYAFSVPAYYAQGMRYYFNTSYKLGAHFQLWFRIAQTKYFNKTEIGSGLSTIFNNRQTDLKLQLMIKM